MALQRIYGRHAVLEALRADSGRIEKIILARGGHGAIWQELQEAAQARGVAVEWQDRRHFDKLTGQAVHQGVLAVLRAKAGMDLEDVLGPVAGQPQALLVVLDEIEDPRNLGAIARCAEGLGAQGLVMTVRRSSEITAVAEKASGGALSHLPAAKVNNLSQALDSIKAAGLWVAGLDAVAGQNIHEADLARPLALVIGNEGKGLRRLTKDKCDLLLKIPMHGAIASLNASVAAGIALYEIQRQRQGKLHGDSVISQVVENENT
jgi:23S rRNA (guanosine2251-2'-O)-methyltransferase